MLTTAPLTLFVLSVSIAGDAAYLTSRAEEIVTSTNYSTMYSTQFIFTSVEFECSGAITGWTTLARDGTARGRPEISIWTPDGSGYTKRGGFLMDDCSGKEEVVEGTGVYLHQGDAIELLYFHQGDVLGMLLRLMKSSDYAPLLVATENTTSYSYTRNGPYGINHRLSPQSAKKTSLLLSLKICVDNPDSNETYPNCSDIVLPDNACPEDASPPTTHTSSLSPSPSSPPSSASPPSSPPPSSSSSSSSSSSLPTWVFIVSITVPCVLVLLVLVIVLVVCVVWYVCLKRREKVDFSPHQSQSSASLPMLSYDTPLPPNGDITHTYETPVRPRPSVNISVDSAESFNLSGSVIANHTRSGSHTEASIYEEPMVSVPQYDSILGAQHQHTYDELLSPDSVQPPSFSHHNSPCLLVTPPPYSATAPYYHTLEGPMRSPSPSPPQIRTNRLGNKISPLVTGASSHSRNASCDSGDGTVEQQAGSFRPHSGSNASQYSNQLPVGYQIIHTDSNIRLNSGVYVPTHQQRSQFSHEPIFDDSIYADLRKAPNSPLAHNWRFFEETDHYWKPASDKAQLYHQLHTQKYREVNRKQIQITEHLGSGEFGTVCKGFWHTNSGTLEVAIKMVQNQASETDKVRFLQEAAILGQFQHTNIVRLHGVVTVNDPVMIVLELMKKGDLKNYLKSLRPVPGELVQPELQNRLLKFCGEVALGLEFLARKDFVHRDIAARNILLTEDCICKIADFGMARDLDNEDYYLSNGGKIPFKWTSPEALHYRKYSTASDVWSYGILLWEIWSLGHTPYGDCQTTDEATALISSGARLPPPPGCPRNIYTLMMECWSPKPSSRPTFTNLLQSLQEPSAHVLHWTEEDSQGHPQATCLGASMEAGIDLYPDLQIMHSKMCV